MLTQEELDSFNHRVLLKAKEVRDLIGDNKIDSINFEFSFVQTRIFKLCSYILKLISDVGSYFSPDDFIRILSGFDDIIDAYNWYVAEFFGDINSDRVNADQISLFGRHLNEVSQRVLEEFYFIAMKSQNSLIFSKVSNIEELNSHLRNKMSELLAESEKYLSSSASRMKDEIGIFVEHHNNLMNKKFLENERIFDSFSSKFFNQNEELGKLKKDTDKRVEEVVNSVASAISQETEVQLTYLKLSVSEADRNREKAKKILGIIGNLGLAGSFRNIASKEGLSAFFMRSLAIFVLFMGVIFAMLNVLDFVFPDVMHPWIVHFFEVPSTVPGVVTQPKPSLTVAASIAASTPNIWAMVFLRIATAFIIIAPALYLAKESARHRQNADRAKRIEAELISLLAFIEDMDKCDRDEVRKKLSDRYFVGNTNDTKSDKDTGLPIEFVQKTIEKIVDKSVDVFGEVVKKKVEGKNTENSSDATSDKTTEGQERGNG